MAGGQVAGKEMIEGTYKGKTMSLPTVIDGDCLIMDMVSRDPNRMHIATLGATGCCWAQLGTWCSDAASTNTVKLATDIEPKRSSHQSRPTVIALQGG